MDAASASVHPRVGRVGVQRGFNVSHFTDTLDQAQKRLGWDVLTSTLNAELNITYNIQVSSSEFIYLVLISEKKKSSTILTIHFGFL